MPQLGIRIPSTALEDLKLEGGRIVYPGPESDPVHRKVRVCPLKELLSELNS